MAKIRVLLIEDNRLLREGISERLNDEEVNVAVVGIREERTSIDFTGNDILRAFDPRCQLDPASRVRQRFRC